MWRRLSLSIAAVTVLALGAAGPAAAHLRIIASVQCCSGGSTAGPATYTITINPFDLLPIGSGPGATPNVFEIPFSLGLFDGSTVVPISGVMGTNVAAGCPAGATCTLTPANSITPGPNGFTLAAGSAGTTDTGITFTISGQLPSTFNAFNASLASLSQITPVNFSPPFTAFPVTWQEDGLLHTPEQPAFAALLDTAHGFAYSSSPDMVPGNPADNEPMMAPVGSGCVGCTGFFNNPSAQNGSPVNPGDWLWFSANFSASGVPATGATVFFTKQQITFTDAKGVGYNLAPPSSTVTFLPVPGTPGVSGPACSETYTNKGTTLTVGATFDTATGAWNIVVPNAGSDEILLTGFAWQVPAGFSKNISSNIDWSGNFGSNVFAVNGSMKWSAAQYTAMPTVNGVAVGGTPIYESVPPSAIGINPAVLHGCTSDHAGTPEGDENNGQPIKNFLIQGPRGGGGSNFTGSWSSTVNIGCPGVCKFTPAFSKKR